MNSSLRLAASVALALAGSAAQAFNCTPTEGEVCTLDLGALSVVFGSGQYSFDGDSQLNGSDGYVIGYTVGTYQFPDLTPLNLGSGRYGFSFAPVMQGNVGGSGFEGDHEAFAYFQFSDLSFAAAPGWKLDSLTLTVTGQRRIVGVASVWLDLPGVPVFSGDSFSASGPLPLDAAGFGAGFTAYTRYEEGEDGDAAVYGTAYARFDSVSLVAQVSAVPEPASWVLWACGALALAWRRAHAGWPRRRLRTQCRAHRRPGEPA